MADATWPITTIRGQLADRNASLPDARLTLTWSDPVDLEVTEGSFSPYMDRAKQGATLMPRPFWFVEPTGAVGDNWRYFGTPEQQSRRADPPWKGLAFEGRIETQYVWATFLEVFPFVLGEVKLVALPVTAAGSGTRLMLHEASEIAAFGTPYFADWMQRTEAVWRDGKKDSASQDVTLAAYLNNHQNLTRQQLQRTRLVYGGKGTNLRAAVIRPADVTAAAPIPAQGLVLDQNFYEIYASEAEAHYLAAILNTDLANDAIKSTQTQGAWGARDIHRRPFEMLPIPEFEAGRPEHRRLSELSVESHQRLDGTTPSTRRDRHLALVRDLADEAQMLAQAICGVALDATVSSTTPLA